MRQQDALVVTPINISGIGANPESASPYVRRRATGEHLVREAFPGTTILRPSVMFARVLPAIPLFAPARSSCSRSM
jgi:NADH dehydrogenase